MNTSVLLRFRLISSSVDPCIVKAVVGIFRNSKKRFSLISPHQRPFREKLTLTDLFSLTDNVGFGLGRLVD